MAVLVYGIFKLQVKIPLRLLFGVSSALLYLLAFVFAGEGIKDLQAVGWISETPSMGTAAADSRHLSNRGNLTGASDLGVIADRGAALALARNGTGGKLQESVSGFIYAGPGNRHERATVALPLRQPAAGGAQVPALQAQNCDPA